MNTDLTTIRRRIQKQLLLLERKDLTREDRGRIVRHLWYWYGFIDALRGEKP